MVNLLKILSAIIAILIYFLILLVVLYAYNRHAQKAKHYVEKNSNRVTVTLVNSDVTVLNRSDKENKPKSIKLPHVVTPHPVKSSLTPTKPLERHTLPKKSKTIKQELDKKREEAQKVKEELLAKKRAKEAKARAEAKAKEEAKRRAKEAKAKEEAKRRAKEAKAREEAKRRAKEAKAKEEAKRRAKEAKAREEAKRRAKEAKAKEEAKRRAKEAKAREEAKRRAKEAKAKEEAKRRAKEAKAREERAKKKRQEQARRERANLFDGLKLPSATPPKNQVHHRSSAMDRIANTQQHGSPSDKNRDKGVVDAYRAKVEKQLRNWSAQSEYKGHSATIKLIIYRSGDFRYTILRSSSPALTQGLKAFLNRLKRMGGLGRHHAAHPYEFNVTFKAR